MHESQHAMHMFLILTFSLYNIKRNAFFSFYLNCHVELFVC